MNFESIEKRLTRAYAQKKVENVTYFLKEGKVVATEENGCIVMYFRCDEHVIWNHHGVVAVAVVKDFQLVQANKNGYQVTMADVVAVGGLCGACATIKKVSNRLVKTTVSRMLEYPEFAIENDPRFVIETLGRVEERGIFEFDDIKIKLEVSEEMCDYDRDELKYSILKVKTNRRKKNSSKYIQDKDYNVYDVLRKEKDWYWNAGYNTAGSRETRALIEHTKLANYHKLGKATVTILQN